MCIRGPHLLLLALGACSGGGESTPIAGSQVPPELLLARARVDSPFSFAELALRSAQNLGTSRVADRAGTERHGRLHPDAVRVVFARERDAGDAGSRELYVSSIDGTVTELRLTQNSVRDDEPCWSPDGSVVLFTSDRNGRSALWRCAADGADPRELLAPPVGGADGEPDWHRGSNRIVFSRRDGSGHHGLWLVNGDGSGELQLTDGGPGTGADSGDHHPAWSPDGTTVAFARQLATGVRILCTLTLGAATPTTIVTTAGAADLPRFAPAGDRLFFGLDEPLSGRPGPRLAVVPAAGGTPSLLWPDERWLLHGIDVLPTLAGAPAAAAPTTLDVTQANLQLAAGSSTFGVRSQLVTADGDEYIVLTQTVEDHETAGLNFRFDLPVTAAEDMLELQVRAVARTMRVGGDTTLRLSVYNPVDERFDTAVELQPSTTAAQTLAFRTGSLRHVTRERQFRVTVVGEVAAGARSELRIDLLEVVLVKRAGS